MKKLLFFLSVLFLLNSCKKDCYKAPEEVIFEFVNSAGENILENNELTSYSIGKENGPEAYTSVETTQTADYKIILKKVGLHNGTQRYRIASSLGLFYFTIKSVPVQTDCEGYQIDQIDFENVEATKENDFYRIVLE